MLLKVLEDLLMEGRGLTVSHEAVSDGSLDAVLGRTELFGGKSEAACLPESVLDVLVK